MENYEKRKEEIREEAKEWQASDKYYSWGEIAERENYFYTQGKKYGLLREFHENGIC
jgi:hypothetical protein